ncbi:hypothetical protein CI109_104366 [Kwoniella shandongensis]|uniref:DUF7137 domain-containing protein n=1 Tax=Kwoniella shandongensis TaxID=1734106 RepID=A0A5M6BYW1_9TREE|nr:uncharacterized protein CI109_004236 [Kwoniella shandongensis]KAA5527420.1 hypothetical protein CI109_004236 [Kwoniella shandongensis]
MSSSTGSGSASASASASRQSGNATSSVSIPGTAAAGGLTVTQPPSTASASYYKIAKDSWITFGWNLTSLYVTPTSLTVVASCSANGNVYPVGPTASPSNVIPGNSTSIVWNPWEWEQIPGQTPFAEATYVLKIVDERGQGAPVKGGYFSPYSGTNFMIYRPGEYKSIADGWSCATCSDALSTLAQPAHFMVLTTLLITILSAWGILRR